MGLESGIQFGISTVLGNRASKRTLDLQQAQQDEMSAVRKAVEERARRAQASGDFEAFAGALTPFEQLFPDAAPEDMRIIRESGASNPVAALQDPNVLTARQRALDAYAPLWKARQEQQRQDALTLAKTRHPMQATDREALARTQATYKALGDALHQPYPQNPPIIKDEATGQMRFMSPKEWYDAALERALSLGNTIGDTAPPGRPQPNPNTFGVAPPQPSPYHQPGAAPAPAPANARPQRRTAAPVTAPSAPVEQTVRMRAPDGRVGDVPLTKVPQALVSGYKRVTE
jgi:hypothetical protein